jgi:hypothetical protein
MELLPCSDYSFGCDQSRFSLKELIPKLIVIKALDGAISAQTPYALSRHDCSHK